MLATGHLLAGAAMALVILRFDAFGYIGRTVVVVALVLLSGILIWASIRITGPAGAGAGKPHPSVRAAQRTAESSERGALVRPSTEVADQASGGSRSEAEGKAPLPAREKGLDDDREAPEDLTVRVEAAGGVGDGDSGEPEAEPEPASTNSAPDVEAGREAEGIDLAGYREMLVRVWERYLRQGDGHFNSHGLQAQLEALGIGEPVSEGGDVGAEGNVLVVEHPEQDSGRFFVLPSFAKSPRAASAWFEDVSDGALTRRTRKIHTLAEGKWTDTGFVVIAKGRIE